MAQHQIIRQLIETPMGFVHIVECTCGRRIAMTNSVKIAERKITYHLDAADSGAI